MTILQALVSFIVAASILTVTPGLDTALVLRSIRAGHQPV
jgi:threonine/homoserine/homoserine lactone efflux protein